MKKIFIVFFVLKTAFGIYNTYASNDLVTYEKETMDKRAQWLFGNEALTNFEGRGPVSNAALYGQKNILASLLISKKDSINPDIYGNIPLHFAAVSGSVPTAELLLKDGSVDDILCKNSVGKTPIHFAVSANKLEMVSFLLNHISTKQRAECMKTIGQVVLFDATQREFEDMVKLLLEFGAPSDACDAYGHYVIHVACAIGDSGVVTLLLKQNPNLVNLKDTQGKTALHYAAQNAREEVIKILINEYKANCNTRDGNQKSPLDIFKDRKGSDMPSGKSFRIRKLLGDNNV